ncbi:hypothetical protein D3C72_2239950 [compost metagenome]
MGHRVVLALDALVHQRVALADSLAVDAQPGVFGDTHFVAAYGIGNLRHGHAFDPRQLRDGAEVEQ